MVKKKTLRPKIRFIRAISETGGLYYHVSAEGH